MSGVREEERGEERNGRGKRGEEEGRSRSDVLSYTRWPHQVHEKEGMDGLGRDGGDSYGSE